MYTVMFLRNNVMKSGMGRYWRAGGWYNVDIMIGPVVVSISTARRSEIKLSWTFWGYFVFSRRWLCRHCLSEWFLEWIL